MSVCIVEKWPKQIRHSKFSSFFPSEIRVSLFLLFRRTKNRAKRAPIVWGENARIQTNHFKIRASVENQNTHFFVPVKDPTGQRIPQTVKEISLTNQMLQPTQDGKLYVQVILQNVHLWKFRDTEGHNYGWFDIFDLSKPR